MNITVPNRFPDADSGFDRYFREQGGKPAAEWRLPSQIEQHQKPAVDFALARTAAGKMLDTLKERPQHWHVFNTAGQAPDQRLALEVGVPVVGSATFLTGAQWVGPQPIGPLVTDTDKVVVAKWLACLHDTPATHIIANLDTPYLRLVPVTFVPRVPRATEQPGLTQVWLNDAWHPIEAARQMHAMQEWTIAAATGPDDVTLQYTRGSDVLLVTLNGMWEECDGEEYQHDVSMSFDRQTLDRLIEVVGQIDRIRKTGVAK